MDLETPCYFYRFVRHDDSPEFDYIGARYLKLPSNVIVPPTDTDHVNDFLTQFPELGHGDVVSFGKYRAELTYIVNKNDTSGRLGWVKNPDDSAAAYLTIPKEILTGTTNGVVKYAPIIAQYDVNLHLCSTDKFLKEKFENHEIPEPWEFNVFFHAGKVIEFFVKFPGKKWREFSWDKVTFEDLEVSSGEFTAIGFNVRVKLEGDSLVRYKEKYTTEGRMSWLQATPALSRSWEVTKGSSQAGPGSMTWIWRFSGPESEEYTARQSIEHFLQDFPHDFL